MTDIRELQTPALLVDRSIFDTNLQLMSQAHPGHRLRPHVKAHKTTELARRQAMLGHDTFTCATIREVEGMAAAGLGKELLLAHEGVGMRPPRRGAPGGGPAPPPPPPPTPPGAPPGGGAGGGGGR